MVPYKQRVQAYLTKSVDSLFRTIQFSNGVIRNMNRVVLSDLKDVSNTAPGDGDVLEWSAAQSKWVPGPGGGGVVPTLQQVMDQGAAYTGTNNFSMASATSNVTDQGFNLALGNASGALASSSIYAAQSLQHLSTGTSGTAELTLDANGSVDLNWKTGGNASGFTIDGTQMLVTDANNTKGLEYAGAYKAFFTTHSLVDKDYVDSSLPATGANDQVPYSNGSGFDFSNNFMFDGNYASIGHGSIDTNQILYVRNQINGKDTLKLFDGTNSGTTSIQLTNTGSTGSAFKRGIDMNVRNLSSGGTGVTGIELNVADSTTASTRTGFAWTGLYMDADWTTKDGYGAVIRTITANALKNTALYLEAANAGVGGHTALQIVDGTQQAGYLLTSDANGNANWQAPPAAPTLAEVMAAGSTASSVGTLVNIATTANDINITSAANAKIEATNSQLNLNAGSAIQFKKAGSSGQLTIDYNNATTVFYDLTGSNIEYFGYSSSNIPGTSAGPKYMRFQPSGSFIVSTGNAGTTTAGGSVSLTSKGGTGGLITHNGIGEGGSTPDSLLPYKGGTITINSNAGDIDLGVRADGSIEYGTDLISSVTQNFVGATDSTNIDNLIPGTSTGVTTSGSGTGLRLTLVVSGGVATKILVTTSYQGSGGANAKNAQGSGFAAGDTITFASATFGGSQDLVITLVEADVAPATISLDGGVELKRDLYDIAGSTGTATQVLSSLGPGLGVSWVTPSSGASAIGDLSDATTSATDNIGLGSGALDSITTGDDNTALGINAGTAISSGARNVFVGHNAGQNFTTAGDCVAIGNNAMGTGTGQSTNIAIGSSALLAVTGIGNIGIGNSAGSSITGGQRNICIGRNANALNTGSYQIAIGSGITTTQASTLALGQSGKMLLHGEFGTAEATKLGVNLGNTWTAPSATLHVKGQGTTYATTNFLIENNGGTQIMKLTDSGDTIAIGKNALDSLTPGSGSFNIGLGTSAGTAITTGDNNVMLGNTSGAAIIGGTDNICIGYYTGGLGLTSASNNVLIGRSAGISNNGASNVAIGYETIRLGTTVDSSVALGYQALRAVTGDRNIGIGYQAGDNITSGTDNIIIGYQVDASSATVVDELNIGDQIVGSMAAADRYTKFTGQVYSPTHTLTAGATVTPDFTNGNVQTVTLDQATTLANPTNLKDGATYIIIVKQDGTGSRTLAFGTAYKFEGGTAPTVSTGANEVDVLTFVSDGTNLYGAAALNFS